MQDVINYKPNTTKEKTWLFNSAASFSGNVKYLFIYISLYRPDIFTCYISGDQSTVDYIKSLGFRACHFKSKEGVELLNNSGVYVNEHCKEIYPAELLDKKILNLYHGVGLKQIEKQADREFLFDRIAKKHIKYNDLFSNNMCFLVTSPFMESHFKKQLDLSDDQIIRAGYPRNTFQNRFKPIETFDHDILKQNGFSSKTKLAIYAPTFRDITPTNFLFNAIKDIEQLSKTLEESDICLIIKLHPEISNDLYFKTLNKKSEQYKNIVLWDNKKDIYEIFNKIDLAIIDYSSIYYDLLSSGVKNFIRYIYDYEDEKHIMIYDYEQNTTGDICKSFDDLLKSIKNYKYNKKNLEAEKINNLFWAYDNEKSFEDIIEQTLSFKIGKKGTLPTLYSFDVFDTIIARHCLQPKGIFFRVMEEIRNSSYKFPSIFISDYVNIRMQAESNCRELLKKTVGNIEITFDSIFERIKEVYELNDSQVNLLKDWEVEFEIDNVTPFNYGIEKIEQLLKDNEKVVLISDMYLPADIIKKMIHKINPSLSNIPLYVSSEYGVQKSTGKLYLKVYKDHSPWKFKEWIHYGDNAHSDGVKARELGIKTVIHAIPKFNSYEGGFVNKARSYDSHLVSGMLSRMRVDSISEKDYFTFSQIAGYMIPYVSWCLDNAIKNDIETLYFISRDGHFLKEVADEIISKKNLKIKTKYIYGSRRAWRVPAMVDKVDDEFFSYFGNLVGVDSYEKLLSSLHITHNSFQKKFSDLGIDKNTKINSSLIVSIREYFRKSEVYQEYLIKKAKEERNIVKMYLTQEINFNEKYAFVEYWARGYTQTCLSNIINNILGRESECIFYYYRSILPTQGKNIRLNYSTTTCSLIPVEAIFANSPYGTVTGYKKNKTIIEPIVQRTKFDSELYWSMSKNLKDFIQLFYTLPFIGDIKEIEKTYSNYAFEWYRDKQDDPYIVKSLGHLFYSEALLGNLTQFAPEFKVNTLELLKSGTSVTALTRSVKISLARSTPEIRKSYIELSKKKSHPILITNKKNTPTRNKASHVITSKNDSSTEHDWSKKIRLSNKLKRNPELFFYDSKKTLVRQIGRIAFHPKLKSSLGLTLTKLTKILINNI
ncbi:MAG: CDP-glycerol glycerophosphotransferase family protein [Plesiomonas sp.]|uniref:CDP-glycerol glycerophosphotransferase family protein n=1 Tax=Plesiomonas sp. TaxID=2486279 RepID=UPI003F2A6C32